MKKFPTFLPFSLLWLALGAMAAATGIEEFYGTAQAHQTVYGHVGFFLLWGLIGTTGLIGLMRFRKVVSLPVWGLHLAFGVMLLGALTTHLTSQKGMLHLRAHQPNQLFTTEQGDFLALPFTAVLDTFQLVCYPGTEAPQDYVSRLTFHTDWGTTQAVVSMNHIHQQEGYRLYQSSFDPDHQGSWLSVNYDPYGTPITYAGYALMALSMLGILFHRRGEFLQLIRHPLLQKRGLWVGLLICALSSAQAAPLPVLPKEKADSLGYKQVMWNDRVAPLHTLARDFVQKLYGKPSYQSLSAEQVLLGWMLYPEEWQQVPLIRIKDKVLRERLQLTQAYCSLQDLFTAEGTYRLQGLWEKEVLKSSKLAKAIQEVDEKVGLILMLHEGTLIQPLPEDGSVEPLSDTRVRAEIFYHQIPFTKVLFMVCLTLGFISFFRLLHRLLRNSTGAGTWGNRLDSLLHGLIWPVVGVQFTAFVLRWYISGRLPVSNGYETMLFIALCTLVITCLIHRRFPSLLAMGYLLAGFTLLVSHLGQMNPQITPLMPVLNSPWLSSHVSLIMLSYALYGLIALNALLALGLGKHRPRQVLQLTLISRILLYPATCCLGIGIFLGAIWANVSWGSYWSWDPKESWALISFLLYGVAFHHHSLPWLRRPVWFHLFMLLGFLSILMTYFGVNYLLGGMHSYAGN